MAHEKEPKQQPARRGGLSEEERGRVAGNPRKDPAEQTCRQDLPEGSQTECNEPARGSLPPAGSEEPAVRLPVDDAVREKGRGLVEEDLLADLEDESDAGDEEE